MHSTDLLALSPSLHLWAPQVVGTWGFANCLLITSGGEAALVDTPYDEPMTRQLLDAAGQVLPPGCEVRTVVLTHANGDHSYGSRHIAGAEVISTRSSLEHLCAEPSPQQMHFLTTQVPADEPIGWYMRRHFGRFHFDGAEPPAPTRTFTGRLALTVGQIPVELIEVGPAHTAGDLIVHLPQQRVVCAGDVLFFDDHPVHWDGPLSAVVAACQAILDLDPVTVIPGHGPVVGQAEVRQYMSYLHQLEGLIHERHSAGKPADQTAEEIISLNLHPQLGLVERIAILTAVEYRHLNGETGRPDLIELARQAARWAYDRRHDASLPTPRSARSTVNPVE